MSDRREQIESKLKELQQEKVVLIEDLDACIEASKRVKDLQEELYNINHSIYELEYQLSRLAA